MRRGIAVTWHSVSFLISAALYFFFVLPRWPELMGDVSHTLGTVLRIATGAVAGLTALPVVFTLLETRKPEFGTPRLALSLRLWSIVGHVTAGVLIAGTAVAEIWLDLDVYGRWLFAIYGGAAAVALLGATAFYLAFAAELPPPPPKPLKPRKAPRDAGKVTEPAEPAEPAQAADDARWAKPKSASRPRPTPTPRRQNSPPTSRRPSPPAPACATVGNASRPAASRSPTDVAGRVTRGGRTAPTAASSRRWHSGNGGETE